MERIVKSAVVPYSPQQMFDLVNDVKAYPQFLPFCVASREISRTPAEMVASLTVAKGPVSQTFTTRNQLHAPDYMDLTLVNGPFKTLSGRWSFESLSDDAQKPSTKVTLRLEFSFSNFMMKRVFGPVFSLIATQMVSAFSNRAKDVYL